MRMACRSCYPVFNAPIPAHAAPAPSRAIRPSRLAVCAKVRRVSCPCSDPSRSHATYVTQWLSIHVVRRPWENDCSRSQHQRQDCDNGEIACVERRGRPQFKDLLFHRGEPCFFAFDLLISDGKDWRSERLIDRKQELRRLLNRMRAASRLEYVDHVDGSGTALFRRVGELDLEGVVAKHKFGPLCHGAREQHLDQDSESCIFAEAGA